MLQRKTVSAVFLAAALGTPAVAQQPAPTAPAAQPAAAQPAPAQGIEEITVTARKRSENLQDTPIAVSAFTAESIESMGIENTQEITAIAPNTYMTMTPGSSANLALAIRGVGGAEPLLTREQGVAIYMDGAYIARVTGAVLDLVDIERVEVLRGPQGTLYGRNATGGAVNYISRKPGEEFGFHQNIGVGSWGRFQTVTRIDTGELFPGFAATGAYLHRQRDGYVDNRLADDNSDPGSLNTDAFRIALGWDITENFRADYAFDYSDVEGHDPAFQLIAVDTATDPLGVDPVGFPGNFVNSLDVSKHRFDKLSMDFDGRSDHLVRGHNLTLSYDFGPVQLKSITTYRDWENDEFGTELDGNDVQIPPTMPIYNAGILPFDPFGLPFGFACPDLGTSPFPFDACLVANPTNPQIFAATNVRNQDQWTQEIDLTGSIGDTFDYVGGFYFFTEDYNEKNVQQFLIPIGFGAVQLATPFVYKGDADSWALFANGTYTLPFLDQRLSVTGGVRYTKDEKSFVKKNLSCPPANLPPCDTFANTTTPGMPPITKNKANWDNVDWEVDVNFAATESITTYFRVATGYKAGGFNLRTATPTIAPFKEESLIQYELGAKTQWWDNRVQLNVAAFYSDYDDIQTDVFAAGPGGATSLTVNAGKAEIPGVEFELLAEPFEGVRLNLNYGWIDPKFNDYVVVDNAGTTVTCSPLTPVGYPCLPDPTVDDFKVNMGSKAGWGYRPDQTLAAGAEYSTRPLGSLGWVLTARLDVRWTDTLIWSPLDDERPSQINNPGPTFTPYRDALKQKPYAVLDARFTVSEISITDRAKLRTSVFGKNITDEDYLMSGIDFGGLGFAGGIFGEPASWGIDFTLDY
jgi:iron complex outermembrane receptor protein